MQQSDRAALDLEQGLVHGDRHVTTEACTQAPSFAHCYGSIFLQGLSSLYDVVRPLHRIERQCPRESAPHLDCRQSLPVGRRQDARLTFFRSPLLLPFDLAIHVSDELSQQGVQLLRIPIPA
jgi:hypothetical protein